MSLGYRRIDTAGPWIVRKADGHGKNWIKNFAHADDFEESNGDGVLTFLEAQGVAPLQAEAYGKAAERLARAAFRGGDQHGLIPRQPASPTDAASVDEFVRRFGLRAFRRPLADDEVRRYSGLFLKEAGRASDFESGASMVIEAMLQSPHFLFRVERSASGSDNPFEIASRLAYFLWDTGSPSSPVGNTPPRDGHDPHDDTPNIPGVRDLKDQLWHPDGALEDVCGGQACSAPIPPENAD